MDNLDTHNVASLYEGLCAGEGVHVGAAVEIHHTPKHGSWLNIAEIELSALTRQCLDRRIDDRSILSTELAAWQQDTNTAQPQVHWHFTTSELNPA